MCERMQGQSTSKENLVDENVDIDEAIMKFLTNHHGKRKKMMM
jgi:hypothetical protein